MSLYSWKQEFYPVPAKEVPVSEAVGHSLTKWEGLRPENLAKHGLRVDGQGYAICEEKEPAIRLEIDSTSCALCEHFADEGLDDLEYETCPRCPLSIVRGDVRCDSAGVYENNLEEHPRLSVEDLELLENETDSPYHTFKNRSDPEPMIFWLKKAKEL